jgi:hypothetical protein
MQQSGLNICINYWGQPRKIQQCIDNFKKTLACSDHLIYVCYTTWETEDVSEFRTVFPEAFIRQVPCPEHLPQMDNKRVDSTNSHKSSYYYGLSLYAKQQSKQTILEYEQQLNLTFDCIVTARTDALVYHGQAFNYYHLLYEGAVFVGDAPNFDVYRTGAVPDVLYLSSRNTMLSTLDHLDVAEHCVVANTNFFHPETSLCNLFKHLNLKIERCVFHTFPRQES